MNKNIYAQREKFNNNMILESKIFRKMKGFLAYHKMRGRRRFIDFLHVKARYRRQGLASELFLSVCTGPMELIVNRVNLAALSFYTSCGFCSSQTPTYEPDITEFSMQTNSFLKSRRILEQKVKYYQYSLQHYKRWGLLSRAEQEDLIMCISKEQNITFRHAKRLLLQKNMQYVLIS